jgi:hypothetical protein
MHRSEQPDDHVIGQRSSAAFCRQIGSTERDWTTSLINLSLSRNTLMATPTQLTDQTPPLRPVPGRRDQGKKPSAAATSLPQVDRQLLQGEQSVEEPRISRIAKRAHELYMARGGEHGRDIEDWLQAEREIDDERDTQPR